MQSTVHEQILVRNSLASLITGITFSVPMAINGPTDQLLSCLDPFYSRMNELRSFIDVC
jgi:hypothetical protein